MSIEKFEEYAKHNIENFCDAMFDGRYYVMRENSRLTKEKKQFLILSCNQSLRLWRYLNREGYKLVPVDSLNKILAISDTIDNVLCGINEDDNIQRLLISIDDEVNAVIGDCDEH